MQETKGYCGRYCGRGQLLAMLGGRFGLSRRWDIPGRMKSRTFRYGFWLLFFAMFFLALPIGIVMMLVFLTFLKAKGDKVN